ncbi:MBL fold metallo-hydrolase [Roseibium limicola]|uniref:MBL fold metallo-hydrolase n=1 Tax=Roseibium limicola TaxID=2816037 RepID=A0A939ENH6_9HYPH|nr:MBL fold metallo-hydrolase [Roseibium limicola]MBO0345137.1 MBL fold metallo-hydrolase [Roseibium limicola]
MTAEFSLRIWGARGSTPTPGASTLRYGGETSCFELRAGDEVILIDCGSGARNLGMELYKSGPCHLNMLFTHTHLDHICGLPFFKPAYDPRFDLTAWAGHFKDETCLIDIISRIMSPPIFPVAAKTLKAVTFKSFHAGDDLPFAGDLKIKTVRLNHPGGACGYRFEFKGKSICIITDHEHGDAEIDANLQAFVQGTDIMIYDAMFSNAEYEVYKGWGHSTWERALELSKAANVQVPVMFHHDPRRSDDELDEIGMAVAEAHPGALIASEGMVLTP